MLVSAYLCRIPVSVEPKSPTLFSLRGILSRVIKTDILVRAAVSYFNFSRFYPLLRKSFTRHDLCHVAVADEDIGEHAPIDILAVRDDADIAFAEKFRKPLLRFDAARFG